MYPAGFVAVVGRELESGAGGPRECDRLERVDKSKDTICGKFAVGETGRPDRDAGLGWVPAMCGGGGEVQGREVGAGGR